MAGISATAASGSTSSSAVPSQDGEASKAKPAGSGGFNRRDIVSLSPQGQASGVMSELAGNGLAAIDSQIAEAGQKLQRLKQAIEVAIASGDAETLEALASKVNQVAAQLGGLLGKITDRGRRIQVQDLLDFAEGLKNSAEAAARGFKAPQAPGGDK
ncbi:hypothetical protein ACFSM5_12145 [Lacibacterium aquatile]|uniref:Chemotaxis protein n=1 Tax=Lacibacterium aquatile TaxID=1168082 RepID=A0ABW5DUJ4_9PROT